MTVNITDMYETQGRLMKPNGKELQLAGADAEEKAKRLNPGDPTSFSDQKDSFARELSDREAGDLGELVAVRWLSAVLPDAHVNAQCTEKGETAEVDVFVNDVPVEIKTRDLARQPPATDLLVSPGELERKDAEHYISVVVSDDRKEVVIQGGATADEIADCYIADYMPGSPRVLGGLISDESTQVVNPNQLINRLRPDTDY